MRAWLHMLAAVRDQQANARAGPDGQSPLRAQLFNVEQMERPRQGAGTRA